MNYFYFDQNNQQQGPVSKPQLKKMAEWGLIEPNTLIEPEGGFIDVAGNIPGLFVTVSSTETQESDDVKVSNETQESGQGGFSFPIIISIIIILWAVVLVCCLSFLPLVTGIIASLCILALTFGIFAVVAVFLYFMGDPNVVRQWERIQQSRQARQQQPKHRLPTPPPPLTTAENDLAEYEKEHELIKQEKERREEIRREEVRQRNEAKRLEEAKQREEWNRRQMEVNLRQEEAKRREEEAKQQAVNRSVGGTTNLWKTKQRCKTIGGILTGLGIVLCFCGYQTKLLQTL